MSQIIFICGNFDLPGGNAAGKRVLGLGCLLRELGYKPVFIGTDNHRTAADILETAGQKAGFTYYGMKASVSSRDWLEVGSHYADCLRVIGRYRMEDITGILLYGNPVISLWSGKLIRWAKKAGKVVIGDCVDWIERNGKWNARNLVKYVDTALSKRWFLPRCDGMIVISRYLERYYRSRGSKTVVIPPVQAPKSGQRSERGSGPLRLIYAGTPFMLDRRIDPADFKDRLDWSIELIGKIQDSPVVFDIYGITREQYLLSVPQHRELLDTRLQDVVVFHGAQPSEVVEQAVRDADFTLLNRQVTKVTTAGFPTKIAESLSLFTPVITNRTSDLEEYVQEGKNGFFLPDGDGEDAASHLADILCAAHERVRDMREYCQQHPRLLYTAFIPAMEAFLREVQA